MRKINIWKGETQSPSHAFQVEFYHDVKAENFVAQIEIQSQMWQEHVGGFPPGPATYYEELRDNSLNQLQERTKQQIISRGGRILELNEQATESV